MCLVKLYLFGKTLFAIELSIPSFLELPTHVTTDDAFLPSSSLFLVQCEDIEFESLGV